MTDNFMAAIEQRANLAFSNEMEMLTFYLTDGQLYGLNVFKIIEILETPKHVTEVPNSHPAIKGAIDFRGRAIPLIDLSDAMGLVPLDYRNNLSYVLVCEYSTTVQGFLISHPNMLINKRWDDIIKPSGDIYDSSYLTAITYVDGVTIQVLDVEKILSEIVGIDSAISTELLDRSKGIVRKEHRILAVDDSKAARTLIGSAMSQLGIRCTILDNGPEALALLEKTTEGKGGEDPFTVIFSDIEMPVMDGFTFTRKVKGDPRFSGIYLALHSSLSNKSNEDKARQMGADAFIPKFQPDNIAKVILDQLEKASLRG
ncbi:MAG: chemotaxis protein CheV [Magnetococcales bacterium]|nr:chemotaxis protein CheV [Magnetococcales bacterium]